MSFEKKLDNEFNDKFNINSPNIKGDHPWNLEHLHADFIELKTLYWERGEWLSLTDVIGHYKDIEEKRDEYGISSDEIGNENCDNEDKLVSKFINFFKVIEDREQFYGEIYPFEINKSKQLIKLTKNELTDRQILYLKLLLSSNLNNFSKSINSDLTKDFEKISAEALKGYLPSSIVREFGKNTTYKGNTILKINKLSEEINIHIRKDEIAKLVKTASQEKGLDLVAYLPFSDSIASMLIILVQCACGKNWTSKTNETKNYETYLDFYKMHPIHSMFIPYSLIIDSNLGFYQSEKLSDKLLFERKRIIDNISDLSFFKELNSYKIVKKSVETKAIEV